MSLAAARAAGAKKALTTQAISSGSKAELIVHFGGSGKGTTRLAYDVLTSGVRADQTPSRLHTILDANSGATLTSYDEIQSGTGRGIQVGTVSIGTTAGTPWSMRDAVGNYTADLNGAEDPFVGTGPVGTIFTDADNNWGNGTIEARARAGVDAHFGAGKSFAYFKSVQGRNGIWGDGVGVRSRVHYGNAYENAFWDGTQLTYGDGAGNARPLTHFNRDGFTDLSAVQSSTGRLFRYPGPGTGFETVVLVGSGWTTGLRPVR